MGALHGFVVVFQVFITEANPHLMSVLEAGFIQFPQSMNLTRVTEVRSAAMHLKCEGWIDRAFQLFLPNDRKLPKLPELRH
jgi:hypothetical protein